MPKPQDTRQAHRTKNLPDEWADALTSEDYGPADPQLEALND